MRIACPSSSSQALLGLHSTNPKNTTTSREPRVDLKRRNSARLREQKKQQAEDSRKKSELRKKTQARRTDIDNTTTRIYVGNLLPATPSDLLKRIFSHFGTISSVIIRCSSGLAVSRVSVPRSQLSDRDRQYATVHFHDASSAKKALTLNGIELNGVRIVVSFSAADLPEATRDLQGLSDHTKSALTDVTLSEQSVLRTDNESKGYRKVDRAGEQRDLSSEETLKGYSKCQEA